jgi:3-methyladenine DNA glycosylase AlkD
LSQDARIQALQASLERLADPGTKAWWERYLKGVIPFRGVKMADIRQTLHSWLAEEEVTEGCSLEEQKALALALMQEPHTEDKLAGMLFFQEVLIPGGGVRWEKDLPQFAALFRGGFLYDWNSVDWFCVRVLGPLIQREGRACAEGIAAWRFSENLWQRRASGVAFVNLAAAGEENFPGFTALVLAICGATVQSQERFAQTGTGWVLRELSRAAPERVAAFIEENLSSFTSEGLRYATAKLPGESQTRLKAAFKRR